MTFDNLRAFKPDRGWLPSIQILDYLEWTLPSVDLCNSRRVYREMRIDRNTGIFQLFVNNQCIMKFVKSQASWTAHYLAEIFAMARSIHVCKGVKIPSTLQPDLIGRQDSTIDTWFRLDSQETTKYLRSQQCLKVLPTRTKSYVCGLCSELAVKSVDSDTKQTSGSPSAQADRRDSITGQEGITSAEKICENLEGHVNGPVQVSGHSVQGQSVHSGVGDPSSESDEINDGCGFSLKAEGSSSADQGSGAGNSGAVSLDRREAKGQLLQSVSGTEGGEIPCTLKEEGSSEISREPTTMTSRCPELVHQGSDMSQEDRSVDNRRVSDRGMGVGSADYGNNHRDALNAANRSDRFSTCEIYSLQEGGSSESEQNCGPVGVGTDLKADNISLDTDSSGFGREKKARSVGGFSVLERPEDPAELDLPEGSSGPAIESGERKTAEFRGDVKVAERNRMQEDDSKSADLQTGNLCRTLDKQVGEGADLGFAGERPKEVPQGAPVPIILKYVGGATDVGHDSENEADTTWPETYQVAPSTSTQEKRDNSRYNQNHPLGDDLHEIGDVPIYQPKREGIKEWVTENDAGIQHFVTQDRISDGSGDSDTRKAISEQNVSAPQAGCVAERSEKTMGFMNQKVLLEHGYGYVLKEGFFQGMPTPDLPLLNNVVPTFRAGKRRKRSTSNEVPSKETTEVAPRKKSPRKEYPCDKCSRKFTTMADLTRHSKVHVKEERCRYKCKKCPKKFVKLATFRKHNISHALEANTCEICKESFRFQALLKKHRRTAHNQCFLCRESFASPAELKTHGQEAHPRKKKKGRKVHQCDQCGKTFKVVAQFRIHRRTHTGEKPFKCKICGMAFASSSYVDRHQVVHAVARPFKCEVCGKTFKHRYNLNCHKRQHMEERPYKCEKCGKGYLMESQLEGHLRTHTGERPFKCEICDKGFTRKGGLRKHHKRHLERPFKCDVCEKSFVLPVELKNHKMDHTGERPFPCGQCDKRFKTALLLKSHLVSHSGVKPYKCDHCNKMFAWQFSLRKHVKTHTGETPFQCDLCGKQLRTKEGLVLHTRMHTGEKPYVCSLCDKTFKSRQGLKLHERTHTGERPYQCDHCGKLFTQTSSLRAHTKAQHMGEFAPKFPETQNVGDFAPKFPEAQNMGDFVAKFPEVQHMGEFPAKYPDMSLNSNMHNYF